jgi:Cdc6-like AAA superfamily ATPase
VARTAAPGIGPVTDPLVEPTRRFIDEVTAALQEVSSGVTGLRTDKLGQDVALEAFNLVCGLISIDGVVTDDELWAVLGAFGSLLETRLAGATPDDLRASGLVETQRAFTDKPSPMLEVLLAADARGTSTHARTYYAAAVEIAFAVAAIDLHTSEDELAAIERFRGMLLRAIDHTDGSRAGSPPLAPATTETPPRPIDELLGELDALVGLAGVKHEVKLVTNLLRVQRIRASRGLPVLEQSRHLIFTGNPGTGKTTVARLLAQIYRTLGVVERGHLVETDRAGLVAGYVGQTAPLVQARFNEADQGVLLIDEAYALVRGGERDFGREAIDTIVKLIEDRRDRIVVVMAGYPDEMDELIESNPGLRSRFPKAIHFPDYSTDELLQIMDTLGEKGGYHLDAGARARARIWLDAIPRDKGFGNGRTARNLFEAAVSTQATRLAPVDSPTDDQLTTLVADDIPAPGEGPLTVVRPATDSL